MAWSPQQEQALHEVKNWLNDPKKKQVFRLFGYAGTGKTTLAREIEQMVGGLVLYGSFTGKAALVLRSKGCSNASTIHSMIYKVEDDEWDDKPRFVLNHDSLVSVADLVIVDEVSMVNDELGKDLLSFGTPVLVLGDPFQLPPVSGTGFFTQDKPDIMLTEIHRQAADNPIIRMSMDIRKGKWVDYGQYGDSLVIDRKEFDVGKILEFDQVIVGRNATRRTLNQRARNIKGIESWLPVDGDKVICLRNNREKGLLNGSLWEIHDIVPSNVRKLIKANVVSIDGSNLNDVDISVPYQFFKGTENELSYSTRRSYDEFDYGYAITAHKAQGSQWDNVVLFDESASFRNTQREWLYTAVTRAAKRITIVM